MSRKLVYGVEVAHNLIHPLSTPPLSVQDCSGAAKLPAGLWHAITLFGKAALDRREQSLTYPTDHRGKSKKMLMVLKIGASPTDPYFPFLQFIPPF
jgi:hypothetical protein